MFYWRCEGNCPLPPQCVGDDKSPSLAREPFLEIQIWGPPQNFTDVSGPETVLHNSSIGFVGDLRAKRSEKFQAVDGISPKRVTIQPPTPKCQCCLPPAYIVLHTI